jgi:hypothetical protein
MTKVAAKKTAGVLGDDLALNAQQVTGVKADRELPVVWAVAKGSMLNKAILVPAALAISAFMPWAITPLLMIGGAFLCFEGFEKIAHKFLHSKQEDEAHHQELSQALANPAVDVLALEKDKIKGAVRTDFILSAEIIVITLGTVANVDFTTRVAVLVGIALLMTVGVYGLVAGIVKLDDFGLHLTQRASAAAQAIGRGILRAADAGPVDRGHGGHVPGGRQHPPAWGPRPGPHGGGLGPCRRWTGMAGDDAGGCARRHRGRRGGAGRGAAGQAHVRAAPGAGLMDAAWLDWVQWPAMLATVFAAWLVGSNREERRNAGFWVFLASNAMWALWGVHDGAWALVALQAALAALNIRGARKTDPEKG